jgi:hypothetical protein
MDHRRGPRCHRRRRDDLNGGILLVDPPLAHFTPITLANQVTLDYDHSRLHPVGHLDR